MYCWPCQLRHAITAAGMEEAHSAPAGAGVRSSEDLVDPKERKKKRRRSDTQAAGPQSSCRGGIGDGTGDGGSEGSAQRTKKAKKAAKRDKKEKKARKRARLEQLEQPPAGAQRTDADDALLNLCELTRYQQVKRLRGLLRKLSLAAGAPKVPLLTFERWLCRAQLSDPGRRPGADPLLPMVRAHPACQRCCCWLLGGHHLAPIRAHAPWTLHRSPTQRTHPLRHRAPTQQTTPCDLLEGGVAGCGRGAGRIGGSRGTSCVRGALRLRRRASPQS